MNVENLIEPEPGQEVAAALAAMDDVEVSVSEFFKTQGDPSHRSHEGGIHHRAILEVHHEFPIPSINHFAGEFLEIAAVKETAPALDLHPNGLPIYSDLNRRLHYVWKI
jgi:hypothetical protein